MLLDRSIFHSWFRHSGGVPADVFIRLSWSSDGDGLSTGGCLEGFPPPPQGAEVFVFFLDPYLGMIWTMQEIGLEYLPLLCLEDLPAWDVTQILDPAGVVILSTSFRRRSCPTPSIRASRFSVLRTNSSYLPAF